MIDLLSNTQVPVTCPGCHHTFSKRFSEVEGKKEIACPKCRAAIALDPGSYRAMRKGRGKGF